MYIYMGMIYINGMRNRHTDLFVTICNLIHINSKIVNPMLKYCNAKDTFRGIAIKVCVWFLKRIPFTRVCDKTL